jgi:hypothetical protein
MYQPWVWKHLEALEAAAKTCDGARQLAFDFLQPKWGSWLDNQPEPLHTVANVQELRDMIIVAKERLRRSDPTKN